MLALWGAWPYEEELSFKLQRASCTSGQLATTVTYIHRPCEINNTLSASDATLYVDGLIGEISIKFLLDSGAAMSVLCYEFIANHQPQIMDSTTVAVGANETPLDVIGYTTLTVSLGPFTTQQRFTIVR